MKRADGIDERRSERVEQLEGLSDVVARLGSILFDGERQVVSNSVDHGRLAR